MAVFKGRDPLILVYANDPDALLGGPPDAPAAGLPPGAEDYVSPLLNKGLGHHPALVRIGEGLDVLAQHVHFRVDIFGPVGKPFAELDDGRDLVACHHPQHIALGHITRQRARQETGLVLGKQQAHHIRQDWVGGKVDSDKVSVGIVFGHPFCRLA